jgi:hypothetical protein
MVLRRAIVMALGATLGLGLLSVSSHASSNARLSASALSSIADITNQEIAKGHVPGAVVLIGQGHEIVYRQAFGVRATPPERVPMTVDTIFDLASLTKVRRAAWHQLAWRMRTVSRGSPSRSDRRTNGRDCRPRWTLLDRR